MRIKILVVLFLFTLSISAQTANSVMQIESKHYSTHPILNSGDAEINFLQQNKKTIQPKLSKTVFGFLPWWEYKSGDYKSIQFDLLTHIAVFSFAADSLGNVSYPAGWPWMDIINQANDDGIKLIATITNFDTKSIHRILTDKGVQNQLFNNIRKIIVPFGMSGVTIDFENIADADLQFAVINFLTDLRDYLVKINPTVTYELSFATPAVGFGKWNFSALLEKCNYLFVMGYDYYGSWSTTTGPSAPFKGTNYNITKSLSQDYGSVDPTKLILGVPYYGNYWRTNSQNSYATVTKYDSAKKNNNWQKFVHYHDLFPAFAQKEKLLDNLSQTPWLRWQDTTWNQIWYDDSSSLAAKYDFALQKNLKGVGIWALGYDEGRNELWELIRTKFSNPAYVGNDQAKLPSEFVLYQNYPNPFNPTTSIEYSVPSTEKVMLDVYDILGRKVVTLVNAIQQAGNYNIQLSTNDYKLTSGVYFYRLTAGRFMQTKKMIVLK